MLASIVRTTIHHRLITLVLALILISFGLRATQQLSIDAFPDVTNVQVQIATEALGRTPEEIERLVTIPLEISMTGLLGLQEMRSLNKSGLSIITLVFTDDTDVFFARQLVMERLLNAATKMPPGIVPVLGPVSTGLGEVYQYTLDHPDDGERALTVEELTHRRVIQDWVVRPLLRSIPGVAEINSQGGYVKQYQVWANPDRLRHYNLTLQQVERAIANNNANSSGGILPLENEQYLVRGVGLIQTLQDIGNIVLDEQGGVPVFVRDIAEVKIGTEVRYGAVMKGGYTESASGIVLMVRGGNAKEIVGNVKAKVAEINERNMLPDGLQIVPYYDRTELVDSALWTVSKVLIEGIILVVIILFIFLGDVRSSLIVVATLVITPLATFMVMNHQNISANLMSLGGMAIAIGLMVDSTVVVVENVYHRLSNASDESRIRTIIDAVIEVGVPVIFGICIIILVFLPLMTLQGMEGKLFSPLAFTIAIALAISLIISLTLSPVLCSYILKGGADHDTKIITILKSAYLRLLDKALSKEKTTISVAIVLLLSSFALFPFLGTSFIPTLMEGSLTPQINRVASISLNETIEMEFEAHKMIMSVPGVERIVSKIGRGESPADPAGQNESDPIVTLDTSAGRTQMDIDEDIRKKLSVLPGVQIVLSQPIAERVDEMLTGVRSEIAIKIFGDELSVLRELSEDISRILKSVPGSQDIRIERLSGQQSLTIDIDRDAIARHGINVADVNELITTAIGGKDVTNLYEGERRFAIALRFPERFRDNIEDIKNLLLRAPDGAMIPLRAVSRINIIDGPAQISREGAKRRVVVGSNVDGRDLGGFVAEIQERLAEEIQLPPGYYFEWGGQFENMERAMATLSIIVPVTIALIFFLLFILFDSVKLAGLTILVLPFASIGGVFALFITGEYLSVPASVGFIALWGIAVLNGVVLLTYIRKLRNDGVSLSEAVVKGCQQRFRPVLMTATVAMLGLVPFLFATGPGSEVQQPLAIVVIGGLITSTLLTLVVLPTLYRWFDEQPDEHTPDQSKQTTAHLQIQSPVTAEAGTPSSYEKL
ncbi:cobalt-zinc-cadmium resistance protein CzcA [Nitrosomonas cryotolerans]|uniref:Cobalt-zinc-cadmium resistance protein CzcA n=1 Tax=Nitrosomonas cryotolerans ATCC 49181 TaxID=1131553 RepID=A0A1N6HC97_9PROT|nr:CusA/CzcA family heavy metal efflux RND transporter [Nitrosomonas cryotolerans]SFP73801.1 cobalt-zinc-cadmium resistance protein CzcA [Nitrosomonas cryotolerans]SIO17402.1 cobalt-zinc-cadmium resistance protein CzcA [Nitrosomonas cryotolerans ATCC 49181]